MSARQHPLVSVVTPVHNGEPYLRECIESVLSQSYRHWEYIIVNNCSRDRTRAIAEEYGAKDGRIRVCDNDSFLPVIASHNRAFNLIAPASKYCKVVSADDWLLPECLARMVELAEANPSAGIVGAYQLSGGEGKWYVRNCGLPYSRSVIPGHEVCRLQLLGKLSVFGNPTSNLYRSDLLRGTDAFYPNATAEADVSACFEHLQKSDFGFVHQVLSYERLHRVRVTTASLERNAYLSAAIGDCLSYGMLYLTAGEAEARVAELLDTYYRYLAVNALKFRDSDFWGYHVRRLDELGFRLSRFKLSQRIVIELADLLLDPKQIVRRLRGRARLRCSRESDRQSASFSTDRLSRLPE